MKYRVGVTDPAERDIDRASDWYAAQVADIGQRWASGVSCAITSLSENPERCGLAHESDDLDFDLHDHELLYGVGRKKTHRILFRILNDTVEVLAVRHAAQGDIALDEI